MTPKLIDSHAHVNFNSFKDDGHAVIRRSLDNDIWMINVGSQFDTSKRAVEMAEEYDGVFAAIGLHPIHLSSTEVDEEELHFKSREEKFDLTRYQRLIDQHSVGTQNFAFKKIVAVGEIGLDYYHIPSDLSIEQIRDIQTPDFIAQLRFAAENDLPVIIHCRDSERGKFDSYRDTLDILKSEIKNGLKLKGVKHSFDGNIEIAQEFFDLGFYVGFTGVITFGKNAEVLRDVARELPLDKIIVETDCPYLSPDPHRGVRNEPSYVEFVAKKLAEIKKSSFDEIAKATVDNTRSLFRI